MGSSGVIKKKSGVEFVNLYETFIYNGGKTFIDISKCVLHTRQTR